MYTFSFFPKISMINRISQSNIVIKHKNNFGKILFWYFFRILFNVPNISDWAAIYKEKLVYTQ